jgi:hypothetical protein
LVIKDIEKFTINVTVRGDDCEYDNSDFGVFLDADFVELFRELGNAVVQIDHIDFNLEGKNTENSSNWKITEKRLTSL